MFTLQIFNANDGRNDIVKHSLVGIVRARFIRFRPTEFSTGKALRVEVYGILTTTGKFCKDSSLMSVPVLYTHSFDIHKPDAFSNVLYSSSLYLYHWMKCKASFFPNLQPLQVVGCVKEKNIVHFGALSSRIDHEQSLFFFRSRDTQRAFAPHFPLGFLECFKSN